ncbi:hypothetical protein [Laspinema palackyanum]|nr:hypothetical protein [Laspinema sp. D2c]
MTPIEKSGGNIGDRILQVPFGIRPGRAIIIEACHPGNGWRSYPLEF